MVAVVELAMAGCGTYRETVYESAHIQSVAQTPEAFPVPTPEVEVTPVPGMSDAEIRRLFGWIEPVEPLPAGPDLEGEGGAVAAAESLPVRRAEVGQGVPAQAYIRMLICSLDWPCTEALSVASTESGLNPYAVNPVSGACAIYQHYPCQCYGDPECDVRLAYAKWRACGGSFWCGWYKWWSN